MIKNWQIFNESNSNDLTKEQAQEIIYYLSEDSSPNREISEEFYNLFGEHFVYYETGYEDMKQFVKDLLSMCRGNQDFTDKMIQSYLIRLKSPDYRTKLTKCEFLNDHNIHDEEYGWIFFEVRLKKDWSKK